MKKYLVLLFFSLSFYSCIPGEDPVQPFDRGDVVIGSTVMGSFYKEQIYFSLDNNTILKQNSITDWDIGFSCIDSTYEIIMNYGKFMSVAEITDKTFEEIILSDVDSIPDEAWRLDNPMGKIDSTAIGQWWTMEDESIISLKKIYIIDRGTNEIGKKLGYVKFQILDYSAGTYKVRFANLKGNVPYEVSITKDNIYNYVHLSFDAQGEVLNLEPPRDQWDLLFSKYTELLYTSEGESMWYSVAGAYINPNNMVATHTINHDFPSITSDVLDTLKFSSYRNAVGHDWKYFDLESSTYKVYPQVVFFIKSVSGFYYKLHFVDFYDDLGNKGTPKFEFQKL